MQYLLNVELFLRSRHGHRGRIHQVQWRVPFHVLVWLRFNATECDIGKGQLAEKECGVLANADGERKSHPSIHICFPFSVGFPWRPSTLSSFATIQSNLNVMMDTTVASIEGPERPRQ